MRMDIKRRNQTVVQLTTGANSPWSQFLLLAWILERRTLILIFSNDPSRYRLIRNTQVLETIDRSLRRSTTCSIPSSQESRALACKLPRIHLRMGLSLLHPTIDVPRHLPWLRVGVILRWFYQRMPLCVGEQVAIGAALEGHQQVVLFKGRQVLAVTEIHRNFRRISWWSKSNLSWHVVE